MRKLADSNSQRIFSIASTGTPDAAMSALSPDTEVFVMNGNYQEEGKTLTKNRFNYITVDHEAI